MRRTPERCAFASALPIPRSSSSFAAPARRPPGRSAGIAAKDLQAELAAADALFNQQKWDEAVAAYRAIMKKAPTLTVINLQIAAAYRNKKDFDGRAGRLFGPAGCRSEQRESKRRNRPDESRAGRREGGGGGAAEGRGRSGRRPRRVLQPGRSESVRGSDRRGREVVRESQRDRSVVGPAAASAGHAGAEKGRQGRCHGTIWPG